MQQTQPDLAALVGSRLCHDLISPIGAIQNGLELLSLTGAEGSSAEMALIQDSCSAAAARIRFFRVAFGGAQSGHRLSEKEIRQTLADLTRGGRLKAEWLPQGDVARQAVQMAFLALLCCESALPQGGTVRLDNARERWVIEARAPRVLVDEALWSRLGQTLPPEEATADRVHFAILALLAADRGKTVLVNTGAEAVRVEIRDA